MNLGATLTTQKEAISNVRCGIQDENSGLQRANTSKIEKLQEDLTIENDLMDKLAIKRKNMKFDSTQLSHANTEI